MSNKYYLYSRDSKGKVRVLILETLPFDVGYVIRKKTGLLDGKLTQQPDKEILKGKAKRTIDEQLTLEVNSILSKQKDKGYLLLDQIILNEVINTVDPMDYTLIDELLPGEKLDQLGATKPMLAQDAHKKKKDSEEYVKKREFFNQPWIVSKKIDGIRTKGILKVDEDGNDYISFLSRGGKPYMASVRNFDRDPELIKFMKEYDCEIDGEIYCHGHHLNELSGDARKQTYVPERHDKLEFWIFDIAKADMTAQERTDILNETVFSSPKIVVLKHYEANSYDDIMEFHNMWVEEDFEGAMARKKDGQYEFGKRSNNIWKFKVFEDGEFKIVGIKEGLRPEDMCFIMEMENGNRFDCKPMGGATVVQEYRDSLDQILGQMGTVKYFGWTSKDVPNIAKFKCVRYEE